MGLAVSCSERSKLTNCRFKLPITSEWEGEVSKWLTEWVTDWVSEWVSERHLFLWHSAPSPCHDSQYERDEICSFCFLQMYSISPRMTGCLDQHSRISRNCCYVFALYQAARRRKYPSSALYLAKKLVTSEWVSEWVWEWVWELFTRNSYYSECYIVDFYRLNRRLPVT